MSFDISVIIPTYNVEQYIEDALNSVVNQTFKGSVEIIIVDDCSTDNTLNIIENFKENHKNVNIKILQQEKNMRQGTARNRGLQEAKGKYVFFLDGDDILDIHAFEKMYQKAEIGSCDFVLCDWAYYYEDKGLVYINNDKFLFHDYLEGEKCEMLLEAATYFTVNKLYNREFLIKNEIKYGEGYIYEDYEFYLDVAQKAEKIGIIQNPYYHVRVNKYSTTKTNRQTMIHIESLIKAVEATVNKLNPRWEQSYYHLYKYIMKKTMNYLRERAPKGQKKKTVKKIVKILNSKKKDYFVPRNIKPIFYFYFRRKYVQNEKINRIILIDNLHATGKLEPLFAKALKIKQTLLKNQTINRLNNKRLENNKKREIQRYSELPINPKMILFLGFDYKYVGNSKYLFDYLMQNNHEGYEMYFVTKNQQIPSKYRVTPRSLKFYKILSQAKLVIAESWVPLDFPKKEGQVWLQLWHGTPFKKLFFDSHEKYISTFNRNHKRNKQKDIAKWDYVLADSNIGAEKLISAFALEKERVLNYGYPRVQWLKDNKNNEELKKEIREKLKIPHDKKVILYVPTWRDYNYKKEKLDLSYLLNINKLKELLGENYVIINKDHSMGPNQAKEKQVIYAPDDIEVQNLILIADLIISDYSSIIFDALAIDKPFYLFINDFEKYEDARGVYEDMSRNLEFVYVETEEELARKILSETDELKPYMEKLKEKYANNHQENSYELLRLKIKEICK